MSKCGVPVVLGLLCLQPLAHPQQVSSVSFSRQIRPLLEEKCGACHSPDARTSGLEISSVAALLKGGNKNGPAVIAGKPSDSPIIQYVRGLREPRMPKGMQPLSEAELRLIEAWIEAGAPDDPAPPAAPQIAVPASDKLLNAALYSANSEELLVLRRGVRLAYVPRPPEPPKGFVNPIDGFVVAKWPKGTRPKLSSESDFVRRVYLDIIGVIPTIAEAQRFFADPSPNKRAKLVNELLDRNADYAAHWTPFWEEAIASSDTGVVGGIVRHGDYRNWIFNSFLKNRPYDVMVAELIDPSMPGYQKPKPQKQNGEYLVYPQFVLNSSHTETIQTASNTAQVFLGTGMKCAGCHDHFLNSEWPQKRFLAFASLFSPHDLEVIRCEQKSGKFVSSKFPFDLPEVPASIPTEINSRLHRLALLLTDPTDARFSQTIVNRLWKRYMGLGLFEPADDYRVDRVPSHPELLNWLAYDFMQHGYDLKHTIRLILTSRTYQLKYDPALEDHFDLAKPKQPRYYRSPALRKLTAEQLIDSIRVATTQQLDPKLRLYLQRKSTDLTRALGRPAARSEVSTARPEDVAVVQELELLNGEEFHSLIYSAPILKENPPLDRLYWAAFDRAPDGKERAVLDKTDDPGDLLWAMFVSPGFEYIR